MQLFRRISRVLDWVKKLNLKSYILYDSIYAASLEWQTVGLEKRLGVVKGWVEVGVANKG